MKVVPFLVVILWSNSLNILVATIRTTEKTTCENWSCNGCSTQICVNDVSRCDNISSKCICESCWKGDNCNIYENFNLPHFKTPNRYVSIKRTEKVVFQLDAVDEDSKNCKDIMKCRCAEIIYKLSENPFFSLQEDKILVKDISNVTMLNYYLEVVAFNFPRLRNNAIKNLFSIQRIFISVIDEVDEIKHARLGRSIIDENHASVAGSISLAAVPYLSSTYYFNIGDLITFRLSATFNASYNLSNINNLRVFVSSQWLDLQDPVMLSFKSANKEKDSYVFSLDQFSSGTLYGNITGRVKESIEPLSSLFLNLNALYNDPDGKLLSTLVYESHPVVYGVFPYVNLIRNQTGIIKVYSGVQFNMNILVPLLNFTLLAEITTNIEDFVFMSISNVKLSTGLSIRYNSGSSSDGSSSGFDFYSSNGDLNYDRASLDLGLITVSKSSSAIDRIINISFLLNVDDHLSLINGSTHFLGIGIQTGANVLWVEQQSIQVLKVEPVLDAHLKVNSSSFVYINDVLNISYNIWHIVSSLSAAHDIKITLLVQHLSAVSGLVKLNDTCYSVLLSSTVLTIADKSMTGSFLMKSTGDITPMANISINMIVSYKNAAGMQKPKIIKFANLFSGSPLIRFDYLSPKVTSSYLCSFVLTVLLKKLKSDLFFKFEISKTNSPVLSIHNVRLESVGSNIVGVNKNATPTYVSNTDKMFFDVAFFDLGTVLNTNENTADEPNNEIVIKFDTIASEQLMFSNDINLWVIASMRHNAIKIWNEKLPANKYLITTLKPCLEVSLIGRFDGSTLNVSLGIKHSSDSTQSAKSVTYEYFLPPFLIFDSEDELGDIRRINILQYKFMKTLAFPDTITHSFKAKLDGSQILLSESFHLEIPVKITFLNYAGQKWSQYKTYQQKIFVGNYKGLIQKDNTLPGYYSLWY